MLTFPAETPDAGITPGFEHGNHDGGTAHSLRLFVSNRQERAIRYGLDEAVAQGVRRDTERPNAILRGDLLDDIRVSSARVDKGAAQGLKELAVSMRPDRSSATWLAPPVTTFWWHSLQLCAL